MTTQNGKPLPPDLQVMADSFVATARKNLEESGRLAPIVLLGRGNEMIPVLVEPLGDKDEAARHIRSVAAALDPDFAFTIIEAWILGPRHAKDYDAIIHRYGSIAASPYGIDSVHFTFETRNGTWAATAEQKPLGLSKKKKTFGEVKFEMFDGLAGRFTGFLSKPAGSASH